VIVKRFTFQINADSLIFLFSTESLKKCRMVLNL